MVAEPLRVAEKEEEPEVVQRWRVGREDFYRIAELGVFGENRVEWLDGEIYTAPLPGGEHATRTDRIARLLIRGLDDSWIVRVQNALHCPRAELGPDFAIVRSSDYIGNTNPTTAELAIEVSVSSLRYDRDTKVEHYAEAGVNHYWVLDISGRRILVFEEPVPNESRYRLMRTLTAADSLTVPGTDVILTGEELLG